MEQIKKIHKVSDMLISAHSVLRDKYTLRSKALDLLIFGSSLWLTAMVFVRPEISIKLAPFSFDEHIWLGILAIITFFFSIVQLRVDWKGKAESHKRAAELFTSVKREAGYITADFPSKTHTEIQRLYDSYDTAGKISISIPEADFNKLKKHHKIKIEISKFLDKKPGKSIFFLRVYIWFRDNIFSDK